MELLDLSRSNQLLYFKTPRALNVTHPAPDLLFDGLVNRGRGYRMYRPDEDEDEPAGSATPEQLALVLTENGQTDDVSGPSAPPTARPPRPDEIVAFGEPKKVQAALYRYRLRARSLLVEQGINILYVAFGTLEWTEAAATDVRIASPLVLVPVRLERDTALDPYTLVPIDEPPVFNPALAFKMDRDFKLPLGLPDGEESDQLSLVGVLDHIRQSVAARKGWLVRSDAHLGLFSFAKQAMYQDLATNWERLREHATVRAIAGEEDGLPEPPGPMLTAREIDTRIAPSDVFQVLDADASQQEAIAAVKAGANLVIQGPPGTGKSQTITNIIAESLAQGKTVLFVSEKMAALEVVEERLIRTNLHDFCLKAHSQALDKRKVVLELALALRSERQLRRHGEAAQELSRLRLLRNQLTAYVDALHDAANPLGRSAYEIHGEIAARSGVPALIFEIPDVASLTPERTALFLDVVQRLQQVGDVLLRANEHPWRGCTLQQVTPQLRAELDEQLRQLAEAADELHQLQARLRTIWGLGPHGSLDAARWLRELLPLLDGRPDVPTEWLRSSSLAPLIETARAYRERTEEYTRRREAALSKYAPEVFAEDLPRIVHDLRAGGLPGAARVAGSGEPAQRVVAQREALQAAVAQATTALRAAARIGADVSPWLGVPRPTTVAQVQRLADVADLVAEDPRPERSWFEVGRLADLSELAGELSALQESANSNRSALGDQFEEEIFALATVELAARFEESYASWTRVLKPGYRRDTGRLKRLLKEKASFGYDDAVRALRQARRLADALARLEAERTSAIASFGRHYAGARTDWESVQHALASVRTIVGWLDSSPSPTLVELMMGARGGPAAIQPHAAALRATVGEMQAALAELRGLISLAGLPISHLEAEAIPIEDLATWLEGWLADLVPLLSAVDAMSTYRTAGPAPIAVLAGEAEEISAIREIEDGLLADAQGLQAAFGHLFDGLDTHWDEVLEALAWTGRVLHHFDGAIPEDSFVDILAAGTRTSVDEQQRVGALVDRVGHLLDGIGRHFDGKTLRVGDEQANHADLANVAAWARDRRAASSLLEEWVDFMRVSTLARDKGLAQLVNGLQEMRPEPRTWRDVFLHQLYVVWLTWRYSQSPELAEFRHQRHEDVIAEFRQLDQQQWRMASLRIAERLLPRRPTVSLAMHSKSEPAILEREATKKKRFRPLRKLFADLPNLLPALKPCMLMSPLSVAQFLGESPVSFDVVIFDEASQILPADAVGAIGRGKQLIVVGDQQQLPPTRFFAAGTQFVEEDPDEETPESILDACLAARLPRKSLLWHYRSRHEHLIAFSNKNFYDRRLITFPSPNDADRAVEFVYVPDGVYDRASQRVNRTEAKRLVDLVVAQAEQHPGQSLGVITFSEAQALAIETEIDGRKRQRPDLEPLLDEDGSRKFFVKSLEHVQGDERDVIFFSVGYGPDQAGHMTMNFGPLNREGGERRLNVAVTRARERIKVLASFRPHDIDLQRTGAKGVTLLRQYLEFAEQGPRALLGAITTQGGDVESPFEGAVADALESHGLKVVTQVGVGGFRIDLGVKAPDSDRYLLGIECDGARYHESKTARDRDRLRQQVLENLGWRIHRVWSTDWIKDPTRETAKIVAAYEQERARLVAADMELADRARYLAEEARRSEDGLPSANGSVSLPAEPREPHGAASIDTVGFAAGTGRDGAVRERSQRQAPTQEYVAVRLPSQGTLETFKRTPYTYLAGLLAQCVAVEGPAHIDRAMRVVAESFGIHRVGRQIRDTLLGALEYPAAADHVERRGEFLWPRPSRPVHVRGAAADGWVRPIREIPPEEMALAAEIILNEAFALHRDDLVVAAARSLGYDRTGAQVSLAVGEVIDRLIADGALISTGDQVRRPDRPFS